MTVLANKKPVEVKVGISPVVAAVTGMVVGAGVAVAGAVAYANQDNRDKVNKVLMDAKDQFNEKKTEVGEKAEKLVNIAKDTVEEVKNI